jgi:protein TonB
MAAKSPQPPAAPDEARKKAGSFLGWAFVISIIVHFTFGGFIPYNHQEAKEQAVEKVSMSHKIKVVVPTPPPPTPPPPTPPPHSTPPPHPATAPPQQPRLKLNVPKTSNNKSTNTSAEHQYVAPVKGSEEGVPQGTVASAPPAPTSGPATAPPPPPTPTPTPRPQCAVPNKDATTTRAVEPEYPEMAKQQGVVGVTQVKVSLSATGSVQGVAVYKSSGNAALDQAALSAARASAYAPEVENCQPIAGSYLFRADFTNQ